MIKLYSAPLSLFARKIEIALAEKAIPFKRIMVPFSQAKGYHPKHPDVLAINPKGQVPVLIEDDLELFDSTLIFEYLEDAYPDIPLYPKNAKARAYCRLIELKADEILLPMVARLMYRTEPADPDAASRAEKEADGKRAENEIKDVYEQLDRALQDRDYFCGQYTVADIAMFMTILFADRLGAPSLATFSTLTEWQARMKLRPPVAKVAGEIAEADRILSV